MSGMRRAEVIYNPAARGGPSLGRLQATLAEVLPGFGVEASLVATDAPGHATVLAAEAEARGAEIVLAAGGDGTLNEVINGLRGPNVTVGVVPGGTVNVWAQEAGIPGGTAAALRAQLDGPALSLDLGRVGDRRFLLMASFGLDAEAIRVVRPRLKRRLGQAAYVLAGLQVGIGYGGFETALRFDGGSPETVEAGLMVFGNTRRYGGRAQITPEASAVDGRLDCVIFRGRGPWAAARMIPAVLRGRHLRSPRVLYRRARRVELRAVGGGALPALQVDGDAVPGPPGVLAPSGALEVRLEAAALRLFVPRAEQPLFRPRTARARRSRGAGRPPVGSGRPPGAIRAAPIPRRRWSG